MKKAKTVEIPLNKTVDFKTYMQLNDHAYKSALFYVTTYNKNSYQIREKLIQKGYIEEDITVTYKDGNTETYNIIDDTLDKLTQQYLLDDYQYTVNVLQNGVDAGKSVQNLKSKLLQNKIPIEMINEALDSNDVELDEAYGLDKLATKTTNSSSFQKLDKYKKQQKLVRTLVSKGFSMGEVYDWIKEHPDIME